MKAWLIIVILAIAPVFVLRRSDPHDPTEAAAMRGDHAAQLDMAFRYLGGAGVPRDRVRSYAWHVIAGASMPNWLENVDVLYTPQLTPAERMEGERMAREIYADIRK